MPICRVYMIVDAGDNPSASLKKQPKLPPPAMIGIEAPPPHVHRFPGPPLTALGPLWCGQPTAGRHSQAQPGAVHNWPCSRDHYLALQPISTIYTDETWVAPLASLAHVSLGRHPDPCRPMGVSPRPGPHRLPSCPCYTCVKVADPYFLHHVEDGGQGVMQKNRPSPMQPSMGSSLGMLARQLQ